MSQLYFSVLFFTHKKLTTNHHHRYKFKIKIKVESPATADNSTFDHSIFAQLSTSLL